jgi:hypothetical protein
MIGSMSNKAIRAPNLKVWGLGLRWIEASDMQAFRFEEAVGRLHTGIMDAGERRRLNVPEMASERERQDRCYESYDPQRPVLVPTNSLLMQVDNEMEFLVIALRNVVKAEERLPKDLRVQMLDGQLVKVLRNLGEHFDEDGGPAEKKLESQYPTLANNQYAYTNKEISIGGVDGIPLSRIREWLSRTDEAIRAALDRSGADWNLDLKSSKVEGDDALPWPPDRLHHHWSIPQLAEQDWPRNEMPTEVAELIAQKFMLDRARDHEG